jgi:hypothetical protein
MANMRAREASAPILTQTRIAHGPLIKAEPAAPVTNGYVGAASKNWSGTSVVNTTNPFTSEAIETVFVVPTAHQAFGACTDNWDYSSLWTGIDGNGSPDVLQAGVEVDAFCSGGTTTPFYSAWVEWYPNYSVRVSSPIINPGDLVFVDVWNTSPTTGIAFFWNYSASVGATYSLTAPAGTHLIGNSVEWIVERPSVSGTLATLTNYIDAAWPSAWAWNLSGLPTVVYYQGTVPALGTLQYITMLDDSNKPISVVSAINGDFLWFENQGSSCGLSNSPPC